MDLKSLLAWGLPDGVVAPDFSLRGADTKLYTLGNFRGKKVLLYFYPQAFSEGCTAQACSFRDEQRDLKNMGFHLIGISTDEISAVQAFAQKHRLSFPLLSDASGKVSRDYKVLLPFGVANRVTFLINEKGVVDQSFRFLRWKTYAQSILEKTSVPSP